jgi:hypothetical protein
MPEVRQAFQTSLGKSFLLIFLLILVMFLSGCPEGAEGGEGAEGAAEAPPAAEAPAEGAEASEGASEEASDSASDDSASETSGDALRAAEENGSDEASHFFVRINEDGVVQTIDELGFKSDIVGRFSKDGQLWEVNRSGAPIRPVAQIRNGQLWEVNRGGNAIRIIGRLRATIQGTTVIDIYSQPGANVGRIGELQPGDAIEILTSQKDWLFIRQPNGEEGWIQSIIPSISRDNEETVSGYQTYRENDLFLVSIPSGWNERQDGDSVTFCPNGSCFDHGRLSRGVIIGTVHQQTRDLQDATDDYVKTLRSNNPKLCQCGSFQSTNFAGRNGLLGGFSNTSEANDPETVTVTRTLLSNGDLFYMIAVAPQREYQNYEETFSTVGHSIQLTE